VYLNTGSGWTLSSSTPPYYFVWNPQSIGGTTIANQDGGGRLVDINGDGPPDFICTTSAYLNTGSGWTASTTWNTPVGTTQDDGLGNTVDNGVQWADVNGDGLPDIINAVMHVVNGTPVCTQRVWLNTGSGWRILISVDIPSHLLLHWRLRQ